MNIAKPYILPLMASNSSNPNDLINELGRQVGALSSKALAHPRRLDESLEKLEQGDLQLQIRMGESDRQLRRMINAQQTLGNSVLLGSLAISSALLVQFIISDAKVFLYKDKQLSFGFLKQCKTLELGKNNLIKPINR